MMFYKIFINYNYKNVTRKAISFTSLSKLHSHPKKKLMCFLPSFITSSSQVSPSALSPCSAAFIACFNAICRRRRRKTTGNYNANSFTDHAYRYKNLVPDLPQKHYFYDMYQKDLLTLVLAIDLETND